MTVASCLRKKDFSEILLSSYKNAVLYHFLANLLAHNKKMYIVEILSGK